MSQIGLANQPHKMHGHSIGPNGKDISRLGNHIYSTYSIFRHCCCWHQIAVTMPFEEILKRANAVNVILVILFLVSPSQLTTIAC